jgi:hypothetical protein
VLLTFLISGICALSGGAMTTGEFTILYFVLIIFFNQEKGAA